jgi:hypothetical protein
VCVAALGELFARDAIGVTGEVRSIFELTSVEVAKGLKEAKEVDVGVDFVEGDGLALGEDAGGVIVGGDAIEVGAETLVLDLNALLGLFLGLALFFFSFTFEPAALNARLDEHGGNGTGNATKNKDSERSNDVSDDVNAITGGSGHRRIGGCLGNRRMPAPGKYQQNEDSSQRADDVL